MPERLQERTKPGRACPIHGATATYTREYSKKDTYYYVYCSECGGLCDSYPA